MKLFLKCSVKCFPLLLLVIGLFVYPYMIESDAETIVIPLEIYEVALEEKECNEDEPEYYIEIFAAYPNDMS